MEKHIDQMTDHELRLAFVRRTHEDQFRHASGISSERLAHLAEHVPVWCAYEDKIGFVPGDETSVSNRAPIVTAVDG